MQIPHIQYFLFASLILTAIASSIAVHRVGRTPALTVSQHVAKTHANIVLFRALFGAATICFGLWAYFWLQQNITLGLVGSLAYVGITICFAGAALIPHIEKTRGGAVHNFLAWGLVYLFPIAIICIIIANADPIIRATGAAALALLFILLTGYIMVKTQRRYFLYYQVAYVAVFFAYMATLTLYV